MTPEMRINGGTWKGRRIATFSGNYRPTTGIIKKSLFDSIGADIEGSRFLDLFAGSGAIGIEALSRGAEFVTFIESGWPQVTILQKNLNKLEAVRISYEIMPMDYTIALSKLREREAGFGFIYCDPPYKGYIPRQILGNIVTSGVLAQNGFLIYEAARKDVRDILEKLPDELYPVREREHGGTAVLFFRWRDAEKNRGR